MKVPTIVFVSIVLCSCLAKYRTSGLFELFSSSRVEIDSLKTFVSPAASVWDGRPWSKDYEEDIFIDYVSSGL